MKRLLVVSIVLLCTVLCLSPLEVVFAGPQPYEAYVTLRVESRSGAHPNICIAGYCEFETVRANTTTTYEFLQQHNTEWEVSVLYSFHTPHMIQEWRSWVYYVDPTLETTEEYSDMSVTTHVHYTE